MTKLFKISAAALIAAMAIAPMASAQTGEIQGDISLGQYMEDDADIVMLGGHLGYGITDNFAVEGEVAFGITEEEIGLATATVSHQAGLFGVLSTTPKDGFSFYGRAGYSFAEVEASAGNVTVSEDIDGLAYGIGAKYFFDDVNGVRLDWTKYTSSDDNVDGDADVVSIGYARKF